MLLLPSCTHPSQAVKRGRTSHGSRGAGKNYTVDLIEDTIDEANDLVSDLRKRAGDILDQGVDLSEKTKKEIVSAVEQGQNAIEKQRKKLTEALGL